MAVSISNPITISTSTGVVTTDTADQFNLSITIRAENSAGSHTRALNVTVTPVTASGLFVATNGSDSTGDGSINSPWRTVHFAVNRLAPGDTLNIRAGNYGGVAVGVSGTQANPITIKSYQNEVVTLDGRIASPANRGVIGITARDWLTFDGLGTSGTGRNLRVIYGTQGVASGQDCVYYEGTAGQVHGNIVFRGMYTAHCGNSGFMIVGLQMGDTPAVGEYRTRNIMIQKCEVEDTNIDSPPGNECISVGGGVDGITVEDCFIHDSNRYGVDYKLGVKNGIIRRNEICRMTNHGIYIDAAVRTVENIYIYYNRVYDCGTNGITIAREANRGPTEGYFQNIRKVYVFCNTFSRNNRGILVYRYSNDTLVGDFDDVKVFNNTFSDNTTEDVELNSNIAAVIQNFLFCNNIHHGGGQPNQKGFGGTPGYTDSNNVGTNPNFTNRNATPPNLHIPVGSTADGAGSASFLPVAVLGSTLAATLGVTNVDLDGDAYASPPAAGAYEA